MKHLAAKPVGIGYSIGEIHCLKINPAPAGRKIESEETKKELSRFDAAIKAVIQDIDNTLSALDLDKEQIEILNTHKMILQDPEMLENIHDVISEELVSLEHALKKNLRNIKKLFAQMEDEYLSARFLDYKDVTQRLLKRLNNDFDNAAEWTDKVILSKEITPSQVLEAYRNKAAGIISFKGSANSHTAILAKSLMIPFMIDCPPDAQNLCDGKLVIMDAVEGKIFIDPDGETKKEYQKKLQSFNKNKQKLAKTAAQESRTKDGKRLKLYCNIEIPEEIEILAKMKIDGIGLFRTEFLYMDRPEPPSEDEQFKIYKLVAKKLNPLPVIIRTMDIGGDKQADYLYVQETNPNLGLRGIRMSFAKLNIFKQQLKAILRAAYFGNIRIMFPMISSVEEIRRAKKEIENCAQELKKEKKKFKADFPVGTMIEVPSAAICANAIAAECDFMSIGTNDLVQYLLAVDRNNDLVSSYYNESDNAVLLLIENVCQAAHKKGIKVAVCGEMASQEKFTELLIGLGVDELSASPAKFAQIKNKIMDVDTIEAKEKVKKILKND